MSQSGHFRAHGRREIDLSAALECVAPHTGPQTGSDSSSAHEVPAPRGGSSKAHERPSSSPVARERPSRSPSKQERPSGAVPTQERSIQSPPLGTGTRIRIVNLSLGGACIEAGEPVAPGSFVTLEIVAPTLWDPLVLRGRVVWSRGERGSPPRSGLSFEHDDATRAFGLFELLGAHDYDV
jgi:PilZ domain